VLRRWRWRWQQPFVQLSPHLHIAPRASQQLTERKISVSWALSWA
jgi:hypothetical protein